MTPHQFTGWGNKAHLKTGVILERIVSWEFVSSLGNVGTRLHMDDGSELLVGDMPNQVEHIIAKHGNKQSGAAA